MKKSIVAAALLAASLSASAFEPLGYPGSTWGVLVGPSSVANGAEKGNILLQGKVEQGIDWMYLDADKNWKLNTYAALNYSLDSKGVGYNNKVVPAIGIKASRKFDNGVLDLGVQAVHENRWKDNTSSNGVQAYASYWFGWNAKK